MYSDLKPHRLTAGMSMPEHENEVFVRLMVYILKYIQSHSRDVRSTRENKVSITMIAQWELQTSVTHPVPRIPLLKSLSFNRGMLMSSYMTMEGDFSYVEDIKCVEAKNKGISMLISIIGYQSHWLTDARFL